MTLAGMLGEYRKAKEAIKVVFELDKTPKERLVLLESLRDEIDLLIGAVTYEDVIRKNDE